MGLEILYYIKIYLIIGMLYAFIMLLTLTNKLKSDAEDDILLVKDARSGIEEFGENVYFFFFFLVITLTWLKILIQTFLKK